MNQRQIELARHALGLPNDKDVSYRNYFTAGPGHPDFDDWQAMAATGSAWTQGPNDYLRGDYVFWLTLAGASKALRPGETIDPEDFSAREPS